MWVDNLAERMAAWRVVCWVAERAEHWAVLMVM